MEIINYDAIILPALSENDPLIFLIHIPNFLPQLTKYESYLNSEEKIRAQRFLHIEDRQRFIIARGCLREMLAYYLQKVAFLPQNITFQMNSYGKLFLENYPLHFNLSHANNKVVITLNRQKEIGIDIEFMQRKIEYLDIAKRFFHIEEFEYLSHLSEKELPIGFFAIWTGKEAIVKCIGKGLSHALDQFSVFPAINNPEKCVPILVEKNKIQLCIKQLNEEFCTALALA